MTTRVLCDVDGIIANFTRAYLDIVRDRLGLEFEEADVKQWDIGDAIGLNKRQRDIVHGDLFSPGLASRLSLYPRARSGITELARATDLWFVTSPLETNPTWCFDRAAWFAARFENVSSGGKPLHKKIIHTPNKSFIDGDIFIDDKLENVEGWIANYPTRLAFLWDMPHNQEAKKKATEERLFHLDKTVFKMDNGVRITNDWSVVHAFAGLTDPHR